MPDLDEQLARSRDDLFDEIAQPPLATVRRRAGALRRRKLAVRSGAAAVALAAVAFAVVPGIAGDGPPPVAAPTVAPTGIGLPRRRHHDQRPRGLAAAARSSTACSPTSSSSTRPPGTC